MQEDAIPRVSGRPPPPRPGRMGPETVSRGRRAFRRFQSTRHSQMPPKAGTTSTRTLSLTPRVSWCPKCPIAKCPPPPLLRRVGNVPSLFQLLVSGAGSWAHGAQAAEDEAGPVAAWSSFLAQGPILPRVDGQAGCAQQIWPRPFTAPECRSVRDHQRQPQEPPSPVAEPASGGSPGTPAQPSHCPPNALLEPGAKHPKRGGPLPVITPSFFLFGLREWVLGTFLGDPAPRWLGIGWAPRRGRGVQDREVGRVITTTTTTDEGTGTQGQGQGCVGREGTSEAAPAAVGGGCQSGWGRLLSVTNAVEPGTWR